LWSVVAIFHDVFILKVNEKIVCFEALTEVPKVKSGTWRDRSIRIPSVEEAKKCGVSYRTPEKLEFPFIDNQWSAWNLDGYLEKIDIQYNNLLVFIIPLWSFPDKVESFFMRLVPTLSSFQIG
jgi:hypothetical protein